MSRIDIGNYEAANFHPSSLNSHSSDFQCHSLIHDTYETFVGSRELSHSFKFIPSFESWNAVATSSPPSLLYAVLIKFPPSAAIRIFHKRPGLSRCSSICGRLSIEVRQWRKNHLQMWVPHSPPTLSRSGDGGSRIVTLTNRVTSQGDVLLYFLAIFVPPASVMIKRGCGADVLINVGLWILGWIPGVIRKCSLTSFWNEAQMLIGMSQTHGGSFRRILNLGWLCEG